MDSGGYSHDDRANKQLEAPIVIVTHEEGRVTQTEYFKSSKPAASDITSPNSSQLLILPK